MKKGREGKGGGKRERDREREREVSVWCGASVEHACGSQNI